MPVHDWTRVAAGIFHDFHHEWISTVKHALNHELKGSKYYALAEQVAGKWGPDVLTLQQPLLASSAARKSRPPHGKKQPPVSPKRKRGSNFGDGATGGALALADSPPQLRYHIVDEKKWYAGKKKAVTIRHVSEHKLVAVLEILSPGNKASRENLNDFIHKAHELLRAGVHFALVDVFPPTRRDPEGIHPILWGDDDDAIFHFDPAKPLTCASYRARATEAYVEPIGVGDSLPTLPVFLLGGEYVPVYLEKTYQAAFEAVPDVWRDVLTAS